MLKPNQNQTSPLLILVGVVACFILSGFAALLYQTAWMRQFSLVFGTSELAVAAVLSAYMGGLALGASIAARYIDKITRPVLFYGLLEGGIALSALAVPLLLKLASLLYIGMFGGQAEPVDASGLGQSFFYLVVAFIVLAIPTAFMGATLPLLTKYVVKSKEQIGSRVGLLYATNTAGAIGGTVVAGFVLLPLLGLNGTVHVGVVINAAVFVIAAWISQKIGQDALTSNVQDSNTAAAQSVEIAPSRRLWILPIMLLSGANSFVYEVLWTRLLGHVLGGSITAFSTMLAGFLSGIAIGSAIASRFAKTRTQAIGLFVVVQCGVAITSIVIYHLLPSLVPDTTGLKGNVLLAIMVLLPATIFIGATFPLAVRILAMDKADAGASSARIYAWNTVGAIVGATIAAFFLIPMFKYEGAIKLAVVVNIMLGLATAALIQKYTKGWRYRTGVITTLILALGVTVLYEPKMPEDVLRSSPIYPLYTGDVRLYEVGRSATVVIIEEWGLLNLRTNGLPEASSILKGAPPIPHSQWMLSTMPVLARPDTESMLIVGLGAGVALEGVPGSVKSIDVIELEPEVLKANISISDERAHDPLDDPRVNVIINDARSALALTNKRYDAIVSQPSHPWTAGASHLYTREFMALARDHLNDDGVYLQWMNSQFVDEHLLRSLCATLLDVFPYVRVYQWNLEVLFFVGSDQPFNIEEDLYKTGRPLNDEVLAYLEKGVGSVEDLVAALVMDQANTEAFAKGGQIITDNDNILATRSSRVMAEDKVLYGSRLAKVIRDYDPLLQEDSEIRKALQGKLNFSYISRRLQNKNMTKRAIDLADALFEAGDPQSLTMVALDQRLQGDSGEANKNLLLALEEDPSNQQARFALLQPWLKAMASDKTRPEYVDKERPNLRGTAAVTVNALLAVTNNDLHTVANLDIELASVLSSDLWYEASVKLRADWRIRVDTPDLQPQLAYDAIRLIDSAIVFSQDVDFFALRLKAGFVVDDPAIIVETARQLIDMDENKIDKAYDKNGALSIGESEVLANHLKLLRQAIEYLEVRPDTHAGKLNYLRKGYSRLFNQVDAL